MENAIVQTADRVLERQQPRHYDKKARELRGLSV
jgi:hypothetical protein